MRWNIPERNSTHIGESVLGWEIGEKTVNNLSQMKHSKTGTNSKSKHTGIKKDETRGFNMNERETKHMKKKAIKINIADKTSRDIQK